MVNVAAITEPSAEVRNNPVHGFAPSLPSHSSANTVVGATVQRAARSAARKFINDSENNPFTDFWDL
jgi:hypothetical protein